jgi:hypothetical protein
MPPHGAQNAFKAFKVFAISHAVHEFLLSTSRPSPGKLISTTAMSPVLTSPRMILSANPFPICFEISRFRGRAPNFGSYPRFANHCLTDSSTSRVILLSSRRSCNSFNLISTISRRASVDRRLKMMNSSILLRNSGASGPHHQQVFSLGRSGINHLQYL